MARFFPSWARVRSARHYTYLNANYYITKIKNKKKLYNVIIYDNFIKQIQVVRKTLQFFLLETAAVWQPFLCLATSTAATHAGKSAGYFSILSVISMDGGHAPKAPRPEARQLCPGRPRRSAGQFSRATFLALLADLPPGARRPFLLGVSVKRSSAASAAALASPSLSLLAGALRRGGPLFSRSLPTAPSSMLAARIQGGEKEEKERARERQRA